MVMSKEAIFHERAREVIQSFSAEVKRSLGHAIWDLQQGFVLTMPLSKRIPSVASGVEELRVKDSSGTYRVFYFTRSRHGILVFHAFEKRSQKTRPHEIKVGQRRLKELMNELET